MSRASAWSSLPRESFAHRAPAGVKLVLASALIFGVGALPARLAWWGLVPVSGLLFVAYAAELPMRVLFRRALLALPFLLGIAVFTLFQPGGSSACGLLLVKTGVSVLALQVLALTTPISELLRALRRAHVPEILCGTIALLHRFLFLLGDESNRMRRARAGRMLRRSRRDVWRAHGSSLGLLFVRAVARAERVEAAMRSRGRA